MKRKKKKSKNVVDIPNLEFLARQLMHAFSLKADFSSEVEEELLSLREPAKPSSSCVDLRSLLWCSIDNDDSRDLDQLTYAEKTEDSYTLFIAVADVSSLVLKGSAIDLHAKTNTTSIYTPAKIFPMLPEKLSTNLTSLNENQDRVALVVKIKINSQGDLLEEGTIFEALVRNQAKLTYKGVGAWLEGGEAPEKVTKIPGLAKTLQYQHEAAQILRSKRHSLGALTLESSETEAKVFDSQVVLELPKQNFASQLIEHFMIAANYVMANLLEKAKIPSLRRVVRIPKRWDRIVQLAKNLQEELPETPNAKALEKFLVKRKQADPETFPDLSLTVIKLLGRGEYVVANPGDAPIGHFGLALSEYTHSTAPNRRYPDLISQRQYKAYLHGAPNPYPLAELQDLANHCTQQEDFSMKIERRMVKSAAALFLSDYIGTTYAGIITGASSKGTWVRITTPPAEGKILEGYEGLDVGDKIFVKLISVNIAKGFINFVRVHKPLKREKELHPFF